ncbi:hypothetical protein [Sphaerisporangium sp. TRM90804]|uniref:hypothetical protein n=1 Tax=Sphaerisporangium sp. TRM90804 TaxID=3031113 RepID=UPI00244ADAA5|nr:hypothetical protein [Sphaerisporangium sp. TRM90804]MDH2426433.1 hypothetical protein [Sphaerisporangium sp. TRM90804]
MSLVVLSYGLGTDSTAVLLRWLLKMLSRVEELEGDLQQRRDRAVAEGWLGEVKGVELTLRFRDKQRQARRLSKMTTEVDLVMPTRT